MPAFSRELRGGALYDINIYNLHLVIGLYGMPNKVSYWANTGFNGIDTSGVAILDYGDWKAVCIGAKDARNSAETILTGQNGILKLNGPPNLFTSFQYEIDGKKGEYSDTTFSTHMVYEFREFERMYREDDWETIVKCMNHTLSVMRVAEALRKDAGIVFPCDEKEFV
ncbi:MAG: hypothetical protein IKE59_00575 [Erysipelotrichaceae bacterium]|nr:hypothetical protein [Erysipelotrichaceae bacterium]